MSRLAINLFGSFQATLDEQPAHFATEKSRALLAYLAVEARRSHRREALSALFWPDHPAAASRANLRQTLHRLRSALNDVDSPKPHLLVSVHNIQLDPAGDHWLDVAEFKRHVSGFRSHCGQDLPLCARCQEALKAAAALYQGEFMAGFSLPGNPEFEFWLLTRQERYHRQALELLGRLGSFYEETGAFSQAAGCAQRLVGLEPWRQSFHRLLMRNLAQAGLRKAAMTQYARCRQLLAEDLGVEPSRKTQQLYELIRDRDDGALRRTQMVERGTGVGYAADLLSTPAPGKVEGDLRQRFVGREDELSKLDSYLRQALAGRGRVVFISGEAGSGKSTLAAEFCRRAMSAEEGLLVAYGASHSRHGLGDPYQPFRELLRQLCGQAENDPEWQPAGREPARRLRAANPVIKQTLVKAGPDLPGTLLPAADVLATSGRGAAVSRIALFEQVTGLLRALSRRWPLLLVLDDLHWIDNASANLLFHLGQHLAGSRILVICAYRPEELSLPGSPAPVANRHPLAPVIASLQRLNGDVHVDLNQADGRAFVEALIGSEPNRLGADFQSSLYEHTGGNALFAVEILRGLQDRRELVKDEQGRWVAKQSLDWNELPPRVEAVIGERFGRLTDYCQALLTAGSVQGKTFLAEVAAEIQGHAVEPAVACLSDVLGRQHRLVEASELEWYGERALSRYSFRHHLFQQYAYQQMDPVARSRAHQATGLVLEALFNGCEEEHALELAGHFEAAGMSEKAIGYLSAAGKAAYRISANDAAIEYFDRALRLLMNLSAGPKRDRSEMTLQLARTAPLLAVGGYATPEIYDAADRVIQLAEQLDEPDYLFSGRLLLLTRYCIQAKYHPARSLAEQLLQRAEAEKNALHLSQAHHFLGYVNFCTGSLAMALAHFDAALRAHDPRFDSPLMTRFIGQNTRFTTLFRKAWTLWFLGFPEQSLVALEETMAGVENFGRDHDLAFTLAIGICPMLYLSRQYDQAKVQAERLLQLACRKELHYFVPFAEVILGSMQVRESQPPGGLDQIKGGIGHYRAGGQKTFLTFCLALLAESLGEDAEASDVLDESLALVNETGERFFEAELWRLRGEFLLKRKGSPARAEACFERALKTAGQQGARSLELRAAISLASTWNRQGRSAEAFNVLAGVYNTFTEGFDTPDLQKARELLGQLDPSNKALCSVN